MNNNEIWKDVVGYEKLYQISNLGRVKSLKRIIDGRWGKTIIAEKILTPRKTKKGYLTVCLYKDKKSKNIKIHRLVAQTYIYNINNLPQVNHKDENKLNNRVDNLEWCNNKYNCNYGNKNVKSKKKIVQLDKDYKIIKVWDSIKDASIALNISNTGIGDCCNKRKYRKSCGGYTWRFLNEINNTNK